MNRIDFTWRPLDTLYFGPPVSMAAGELNHGHSLFPPPPMTFQGVVRSRLLAAARPPLDLDDWSRAAIEERAALVGGPDSLPPGWQLAGPFPARIGTAAEPWFPTPRFALKRRGHRPGDPPVPAHWIRSAHPGRNDLWTGANQGQWLAGAPEQGAEEAMDGWVSARNLRFLLTGRGAWDRDGFGRETPPFVKREPRTGVAVDQRSGSAIDGLLYAVSPLRLAPDGGFLGRLEAALPGRLDGAALTSGWGTAGRGARPIHFEAARRLDPDWEHVRSGAHLPADVAEGALFWLVSIAPARVADVHAPISATIPAGATCTARAALTGPALMLGGLSMVRGDSRANRAHVPAGSAWLVEVRGDSPGARRAALSALHDRPSIGAAEDHGFGFGHTLVGLHQEA